MLHAKNLMTVPVVTVDPDNNVDRAIQLMLDHQISGLPVVDREGRAVGMVSEFDLLELICEGQTGNDNVYHYMTGGLVGVAEDDDWVAVANVFREKRVRRLPVLRDGKLVGIIARRDLMRAIRDARQRLRSRLVRGAG